MALWGGNVDNFKLDLEVVEQEGAEIRLHLNKGKSEIICENPEISDPIVQCLPGAKIVDPSKAAMLGSPIGDVSSVSDALTTKVNQLKRMGEWLQLLSAHDTILLLKHSFSLPKLLYNLRTSPCFLSPVLQVYDELLKSTLSGITNIHFGEYDLAWSQATLPVRIGGLGIRCAVDLAPSAYLASTAASLDLVHHIIPARLQGLPLTRVSDAFALWSQGHDRAPPEEG